jgi:hypothetical protein
MQVSDMLSICVRNINSFGVFFIHSLIFFRDIIIIIIYLFIESETCFDMFPFNFAYFLFVCVHIRFCYVCLFE